MFAGDRETVGQGPAKNVSPGTSHGIVPDTGLGQRIGNLLDKARTRGDLANLASLINE